MLLTMDARSFVLILALVVVATKATWFQSRYETMDWRYCGSCYRQQRGYHSPAQYCSTVQKTDLFNKDGWCCRSEHPLNSCEGKCAGGKVRPQLFQYDPRVRGRLPSLVNDGRPCCSATSTSISLVSYICTRWHECRRFRYWVAQPKGCHCKSCKQCSY